MFVGGGVIGGPRPAEATFAGATAVFAIGQTKTIPCTYGPEHATRYGFCVIAGAINANSDTTGNITDVSINGVGCTQLFLQQSAASHASAWGCAMPTGTSGNCVVRRLIGNGLSTLLASVFTVNYLRNPLTLLEKADFISDVQADPWNVSLLTQNGGAILCSILGPGPNSSNAVATSTTGMVIDNSIFGASPNTIEVCSAHYDDTPGSAAFPFSFNSTGAGNVGGTTISLR